MSRDWREIMGARPLGAFVKPTHNPQNHPAKPDFADIAYENQTCGSEAPRSAPAVIEATFKPTVELVWPEPREKVTPINPEFPTCPDCRISRYWISPKGKVVCGKCGEVRFLLAAIQYHAIH